MPGSAARVGMRLKMVQCCFTATTETIRTIRVTAQDSHPDFHGTAPEL